MGGATEWGALKVVRREKLWKEEGDEKWREQEQSGDANERKTV